MPLAQAYIIYGTLHRVTGATVLQPGASILFRTNKTLFIARQETTLQNAVIALGRALAFPVRLMALGLSAVVLLFVPKPVAAGSTRRWTEPADRTLFAHAEDNQLI